MTSPFWDIEEVILLNTVLKGMTAYRETSVAAWQELKGQAQNVRSRNKMEGVLLHDELHRKLTYMQSVETSTKLRCAVLCYVIH
jgi:hypothetical protein